LTDVGKVREKNEDKFWIDKKGTFLAIVDGMGGHKAGDVASEKAIELLQSVFSEKELVSFKDKGISPDTFLKEGLILISQKIHKMGEKNVEFEGMGCTAAVAYLDKNIVHSCHVGDSRIYVCTKKKIHQLGFDHSFVAEKLKKGEISKDGARQSSYRNILTMSLGMPGLVLPEYNKTRIKPGDCLLLCSDGLWDMLQDEKIHEIIMASENPKSICENLILEANLSGGNDNITVIALLYDSN